MLNTRKMLNENEIAQVIGGIIRKVNTGIEGLDAALRLRPEKSSKQISHLKNGTLVDTITDALEYDPVSGRTFVEVQLDDGRTGYIAASIIGMKR